MSRGGCMTCSSGCCAGRKSENAIPLFGRCRDSKMALMGHTRQELERRLDRIEKEIAELKAAFAVYSQQPWYRQIAGSFAGDPAFAEIIRLGRLARRGRLKN